MLGFCDQDSVVSMAARVKQHGMKLMVDFHYSDHFAIRYSRIFPREWTELDNTNSRRWQNIPTQYLCALKKEELYLEYVQVEMRLIMDYYFR